MTRGNLHPNSAMGKRSAFTHPDMIRVGTIGAGASASSFAGTSRKQLPSSGSPQSVAARERRELDRRELYVGMTRARDGLWVGALGRRA